MSLFLEKSDYTLWNAVSWGNFQKHYELAGKESCSWGHRVIYILEAPPLISQIVSIFETFLALAAEYCLSDSSQTERKENPQSNGPPQRIQGEIEKFPIDDQKNQTNVQQNLFPNLSLTNPKNETVLKINLSEEPLAIKNEAATKIEFYVSTQKDLDKNFISQIKSFKFSYPNATEWSIIGKEGETITFTEELIEKFLLVSKIKSLSLQNIHARALLFNDAVKKNPYSKLNKVSDYYNKLPLSAPKETDVHVKECLIELPSECENTQELKEKMVVKKLLIEGKVVNLLIMGGSNSGKSTLFEILSGDLSPRGRSQMFVGTKDPTHRSALLVRGKKNNKELFQLNVLDSPGLNETVKISSQNDSRKNEDLLNLIQENNLKFFGGVKGFEKIDQVVLTCRIITGLNVNDLKAITESLKYIEENGYNGKPPIIVVTGTETLKPKAKYNLIQDFKLAVNETHPELLKVEILFSGVPNINDVEQNLQGTVEAQLKNCFKMGQTFVHNLFQQNVNDKLVFQAVRKDILFDGGTVNKSKD